ncbi:hypothetical protein BH11BAC2_BH11BAC2_06000 [soil metagenome]
MNTSENKNPAAEVLTQLDTHIRAIKSLLNELEPSERLRFLNEMIIRVMPSRESKPASASEKIHSRIRSNNNLSEIEKALISKITKNTEELYRTMQDDGC